MRAEADSLGYKLGSEKLESKKEFDQPAGDPAPALD